MFIKCVATKKCLKLTRYLRLINEFILNIPNSLNGFNTKAKIMFAKWWQSNRGKWVRNGGWVNQLKLLVNSALAIKHWLCQKDVRQSRGQWRLPANRLRKWIRRIALIMMMQRSFLSKELNSKLKLITLIVS